MMWSVRTIRAETRKWLHLLSGDVCMVFLGVGIYQMASNATHGQRQRHMSILFLPCCLWISFIHISSGRIASEHWCHHIQWNTINLTQTSTEKETVTMTIVLKIDVELMSVVRGPSFPTNLFKTSGPRSEGSLRPNPARILILKILRSRKHEIKMWASCLSFVCFSLTHDANLFPHLLWRHFYH